jgi:hypothetical protein
MGVDLHAASGLWRARISTNGKRRSLGYFKTADEAQAAYFKAKAVEHSCWAGRAETVRNIAAKAGVFIPDEREAA